MARGRRGVSVDQEEKLYSLILECLLLGDTFAQVKEKVQRRAPTLSHPTISKWVEAVCDAIAITRKDANEGRAFRLGLADQRLHDLYERSIKNNDLKTALAVTQQYIKLHGLEIRKPPTNAISITTSGPTVVGTARGNVTAIKQDDDESPQPTPKSPEEMKKLLGMSSQEPEIIDQEDEDDESGVGEGDAADPSGDGRGEGDPDVSTGDSGEVD